MRALVVAGGSGTRLRPLTDATPKPMVEFMGAPFAVGQLRRLAASGVSRATFLVGPYQGWFAELVAAGEALGVTVDFEPEDEPLDTAGAARRALRDQVGEPVLVCNGDILTDLDYGDVVAAHRAAGVAATLTLTRVEDTSAYGVVVTDGADLVTRFVEKPEPGTLPDDTVNAGTYVLEPGVLGAFPGDGRLSFEREVFPGLLAAGTAVLGLVSGAHWADLGTPERYLAGHRAVLDGSCAWPHALRPDGDTIMRAGSAKVAGTADLGPYVVVGEQAEVGEGAILRDVVVHARARIGRGARLSSTIVGPDAVIPDGAELTDAVVV